MHHRPEILSQQLQDFHQKKHHNKGPLFNRVLYLFCICYYHIFDYPGEFSRIWLHIHLIAWETDLSFQTLSDPSFPDDKGPPFRKPTRLSTTRMDVVAKLCPVFGEGMSYLVSQFCGMEKRPRQHRQRASLQKITHKHLHGLNMGTRCLIQRRGLECCIVHDIFFFGSSIYIPQQAN